MADHNNAKDAVTAWLNESEGFSLRIERLHEDAASGNDLVPWLVEAFRLGADRAAPEGQVQCCMCGRKDLSTTEDDGGKECQLWDGRWTCSRGCYDKACMIHEASLTPQPVAPLGQMRAQGSPWPDLHGQNLTPGSPGRLIDCNKCAACGHSVTMVGSDENAHI